MRQFERFTCLLLAVLLIMISGFLPVITHAADEDIYIFNRDSNGDYLYQYQSPCMLGYDIDNKNGGNGVPIQAFIYTLYNTRTKTIVPTYCTDAHITAVQGANYRRQNLEDSSFSGNSAGLIRAILTHGFYLNPADYDTPEEHKEAVDAKVAEMAENAHVDSLTAGEAIAATQAAIWRAAHGPVISFPKFCRYVFNPTHTKYVDLCSYDILKTKDTTLINSTIEKVYSYLLSLDPIPASQKVVSPSSFVMLRDPVFTLNNNGKYDVSVTTTVDVDLINGETLTLKADLSGYTAQTTVSDGKHEITLTISDVPASVSSEDVILSLSGYQTASGYYLFDAEGGRDAAQTMVAYDSSRQAVYAEVVAAKTRILNIHKSTESGVPINDITFDIHYITSFENANNLPAPSEQQHPELSDYTVTTDQNGFATLNFTQLGLPDGVYLVVERNSPKVVAPVEPFYLYVPSALPSGTVYDIHIYPKNELVGGDPGLKGGINLLKVDFDDNTPLAGAVFEVYRTATMDELTEKADELSNIPGVAGKVLQVPFFTNKEEEGDEVLSVTSDENGKIGIYGLRYGTYYLVEKSAPAGYNLMESALEFTIDEESHLENHTITVKNQKGSLLPNTGGPGTDIFIFGGGSLIMIGSLFLVLKKFKSRRFF